jgi:NAD(P)-dependent dehydrogenase (short-subunit alcohol dehydrogenase family)
MSKDLVGRNYLVTGANTGIGRVTAHDLARRGGRVFLACRSEEKTRPVIEAIRSETGSELVEFLPLDLADLASVRACAAQFLARDLPLHVLVNNAGLAGQHGATRQGFETTFGVNHLGHFLLTQLLLDRLKQSAPARIVNVSSIAHFKVERIDWEALRKPTATRVGLHEYEISKLCNVLFSLELARRLEGTRVTTYSLHPGVVATDVWRNIPWPVRSVIKLFMKSIEDGAQTTIYCATSPDVAGQSGRYYDDKKERNPSKLVTPALAQELWQRSEAWVAA